MAVFDGKCMKYVKFDVVARHKQTYKSCCRYILGTYSTAYVCLYKKLVVLGEWVTLDSIYCIGSGGILLYHIYSVYRAYGYIIYPEVFCCTMYMVL